MHSRITKYIRLKYCRDYLGKHFNDSRVKARNFKFFKKKKSLGHKVIGQEERKLNVNLKFSSSFFGK